VDRDVGLEQVGGQHLLLDRADQLRDRLVTLVENRPPEVSPAAALREDAIALVQDNAQVFQTITDETRRRAHDGQTPKQIAAGLRPTITAMLRELDQWHPIAEPQQHGA